MQSITRHVHIYNMMKKYNLGLVKGHYFINDYTELTSYYLETSYYLAHYEKVKDIKDCNSTYKKLNDKYKKGSYIY